ncbi:hypothetical protein HanRHA438_Chr13g0623031 [Helianthus annuus]|nr:hypothetical protein HanRHA438_Chr13g0623031 [Helianthus annuus]
MKSNYSLTPWTFQIDLKRKRRKTIMDPHLSIVGNYLRAQLYVKTCILAFPTHVLRKEEVCFGYVH